VRDRGRKSEREGRGAVEKEGEATGQKEAERRRDGRRRKKEGVREARRVDNRTLVSLSRFVLLLSFARERGG